MALGPKHGPRPEAYGMRPTARYVWGWPLARAMRHAKRKTPNPIGESNGPPLLTVRALKGSARYTGHRSREQCPVRRVFPGTALWNGARAIGEA